VASTPSPEKVCWPLPATVLMFPPLISRMRLLLVSTTYTLVDPEKVMIQIVSHDIARLIGAGMS
jgi:hypothetical protein